MLPVLAALRSDSGSRFGGAAQARRIHTKKKERAMTTLIGRPHTGRLSVRPVPRTAQPPAPCSVHFARGVA